MVNLSKVMAPARDLNLNHPVLDSTDYLQARAQCRRQGYRNCISAFAGNLGAVLRGLDLANATMYLHDLTSYVNVKVTIACASYTIL